MDYKHWLKNLDLNLSSLEKLKELNYFVMKNWDYAIEFVLFLNIN